MSLPFNHVENIMADIAVVFHWTPADMSDMSVDELLQWHERARVRNEVKED